MESQVEALDANALAAAAKQAANKNKYCTRCKKKGHSTNECFFKSKNPKENPKDKPKDKKTDYSLTAFNAISKTPRWIIDSGASEHLCSDLNIMTDVINVPKRVFHSANGNSLLIRKEQFF
jgi:hypothetical protein